MREAKLGKRRGGSERDGFAAADHAADLLALLAGQARRVQGGDDACRGRAVFHRAAAVVVRRGLPRALGEAEAVGFVQQLGLAQGVVGLPGVQACGDKAGKARIAQGPAQVKPRLLLPQTFGLGHQALEQGADWRLRVHCSKGTYIRTLCQDIGAALGCGGCMAALRRTKAGAFSLDQAIPLADLIADPDAASRLLGVDTLFAQYPAVTLTARQEQLCRNGAAFTMRGLPAGFVRVYSQSGAFLMLGRERDGRLATEKSFFEVSTT